MAIEQLESTDQIKAFCRNLKTFREARDLNQVELAEQCNFSKSYIGKIERGDKYPSFETMLRISDALDVSLIELFDMSHDMSQPAQPTNDIEPSSNGSNSNGNGSNGSVKTGESASSTELPDSEPGLESMPEFVRFFDQLDIGLCISSRDGTILHSNLTFNYLTKKINGDLVGMMIQDVDPRFQDQDYEDFWDSLDLGDYTTCEVPGSPLSGSSLPVTFLTSKLHVQSNLFLISVAYPNPIQSPAPNGNNGNGHSDLSPEPADSPFELSDRDVFLERLHQTLREASHDENETTFTLGVLLLNREGQHLPDEESLLPGQILSQLILNFGQCLRNSDRMTLLDSNELGFMLSNTNSNQTVAMLERIQQLFKTSQEPPGTNQQNQEQTLPLFQQSVPPLEESTRLLAQAGIAEFPVDGNTPDDLMNTARNNAQVKELSFKIFA